MRLSAAHAVSALLEGQMEGERLEEVAAAKPQSQLTADKTAVTTDS